MRIRKPDVGSRNMRKLTSSEAKELKFDHKILSKLMIMTEETGEITFWMPNAKTGEATRFTGSNLEYFDTDKANTALEQFWVKFGLA